MNDVFNTTEQALASWAKFTEEHPIFKGREDVEAIYMVAFVDGTERRAAWSESL